MKETVNVTVDTRPTVEGAQTTIPAQVLAPGILDQSTGLFLLYCLWEGAFNGISMCDFSSRVGNFCTFQCPAT
jgi:hypothetical protein